MGLAGAVSLTANAQDGSVCQTPIYALALPYSATGNTINFGNDYTSADVPALADDAVVTGTGTTSYLNGFDVVYAYQPTQAQIITVRANGVDAWTGLWAFTGCPFTQTVGYHTSSSAGDLAIAGLTVLPGNTYYFVISTWPSPESTEYVFEITLDSQIDDCTALPTPGATVGPTSLCSGESATYTLESSPIMGGLSYLWQTSSDGTNWSNAAGNNTGTSYMATITAETWLRCQATCGVAGSAYSTPVHVTIKPADQCYCEPSFSTVEPICNVTFADINNDSPGEVGGAPAVEDFSSVVAHVVRNGNYTISATGNTAGSYTCHIVAFFDWDRNGVYETSINLGSIVGDNCTEVISASVDVPADAAIGMGRMLVVKNFSTVPANPCSNYTWGQAEVYSIEVSDNVGVNEVTAANGWAIHPNPASTELFITAPEGNRTHVRVFGMLGQLVMESGPTHRLDVANLAPGTYNLLLLDEQGQVQGRTRFVKQ